MPHTGLIDQLRKDVNPITLNLCPGPIQQRLSLRLAQLDTYPLQQLERGLSDRPFLLVGQYAKYRLHS